MIPRFDEDNSTTKQFNEVETPSDNVIAETATEVSGKSQPNTSNVDYNANHNMNFQIPKTCGSIID